MVKENVTPNRIAEVAKSGCLEGVDQELVSQLTADHIAVSYAVLHYGKGPDNPLNDVTFYSKQQPDGERSDYILHVSISKDLRSWSQCRL